jgi:hypothetical protein
LVDTDKLDILHLYTDMLRLGMGTRTQMYFTCPLLKGINKYTRTHHETPTHLTDTIIITTIEILMKYLHRYHLKTLTQTPTQSTLVLSL